MTAATHRSSVRRFAGHEIETDRSIGLRSDHEALRDGRTIFPSTVIGTMESPRFLVSGHNNPKLGKAVLKGPRTGWPIFQVTLEERATCPRSCHAWSTCYGNTMPYARRHRPDADFMEALQAEVLTVARQYPEGLLVRLHTLGDFFSVEYVRLWRDLLLRLPQLHVFGYTARTSDAPDAQSRAIAAEINKLAERQWDRFAIRVSRSEPGAERSIIVDEDPGLPDVIVCPAQVHKTEACASCGLCWADAARDKTIAFLRHGMKSGAGREHRPRVSEGAHEPRSSGRKRGVSRSNQALDAIRAALPSLFERFPTGASSADVMAATGLPYQRTVDTLRELASLGECQWVRSGGLAKMLLPVEAHVPASRPAEAPSPRAAPRSSGPKITKHAAGLSATWRPRGLAAVKPGQIEDPALDSGPTPFRRTTIDRREPSSVSTRQLMGDPDPTRLTPAQMSADDIRRHNAAIFARLNYGARAEVDLPGEAK